MSKFECSKRVSVEEFERFKSEAEAIILQKNKKIMEWENQPLVSERLLKQRLNELEKEIVNDFEAFRITDYVHARFKSLLKTVQVSKK